MKEEFDLYAELMSREAWHLMASRRSDTRLETVAQHMQQCDHGAFMGTAAEQEEPPLTLEDLYCVAREQIRAFRAGRHSDTRWLSLAALLIDLADAGRRADAGWLRVDPVLQAKFDQVLLGRFIRAA